MSNKVSNALGATKASLLYLYEAYKEDGLTDEESKSEVAYQLITELNKLNMMNDYVTISLDNKNLELLQALHKQVSLVANSKQQHVAQVGSRIAELISMLFA